MLLKLTLSAIYALKPSYTPGAIIISLVASMRRSLVAAEGLFAEVGSMLRNTCRLGVLLLGLAMFLCCIGYCWWWLHTWDEHRDIGVCDESAPIGATLTTPIGLGEQALERVEERAISYFFRLLRRTQLSTRTFPPASPIELSDLWRCITLCAAT